MADHRWTSRSSTLDHGPVRAASVRLRLTLDHSGDLVLSNLAILFKFWHAGIFPGAIHCMSKLSELARIDPALARIIVVTDPNYYRALGEFIEAFSGCEAIVFSVLTFYAGTPIPIAKAIFSGQTMDSAIGHIKRLAKVRGMAPERRADLARIFWQLKLIAEIRNKIVH